MDSEVGGMDRVRSIIIGELGGGEVESQSIGAGSEVHQSLEM